MIYPLRIGGTEALVANETIDEHLTLPTVGVKVLPHLDDRGFVVVLRLPPRCSSSPDTDFSIMQLGTEVKTRQAGACNSVPVAALVGIGVHLMDEI